MFMQITKKIFVLVYLMLSLLFFNCGSKKEDAKSMEQIRLEEGIPVKVESVTPKMFQKNLTFYSKLTGVKESTKGALIGGKIDRVLARVGDRVAKDQVLVEFDRTNPGIQYEQAKSAFEIAEKTYLRTKALLEAGETSQAAYDGAETQYLVAKRNYEAVKQALFIQSPFDGIVVDIKVKDGDNVKNEAHLFTVAQLHKMRTKLWATENEIIHIKKGMKVTTEYLGESFIGKVIEVSLAADPYKQAFYAEVEFDNPKNKLPSGIVLEFKVVIYENPNAIIIPRNLVQKDDKGMFVFVEKNSSAVKTYIKNGFDSGADYEVSSGLRAGDKLIVQGANLLEDGAKVKVIQ